MAAARAEHPFRRPLPGRLAAGLLAGALAASLLACGGGEPKKAGKKKKEGGQPTELTWQIKQFRLVEPCKGAAAAPATALPATPTAIPTPAPTATPAPTVPAATPPAATPTPEGAAPAAAGDAAAPPPPPAPAEPIACVRFLASYPEFEGGLQRPLLRRLDEAVEFLITSPSFDERRAGSVDGTARRLVAAWKARLQERTGAEKNILPQPWYDERKVSVLYRDRQVISLQLEEKLFAGGAHELSTVLLESYSLDRVDRLSMADLFVEGSAARLNELGEKKFRELRGIAPGRSLADAGFDFPGGIFRLSANFAIRAEGVVFRYNPYDIGPFSLGATDLLLPNAEIRELLRPKGPLGSRLDPAAAQEAAPAPPAAPSSTEGG